MLEVLAEVSPEFSLPSNGPEYLKLGMAGLAGFVAIVLGAVCLRRLEGADRKIALIGMMFITSLAIVLIFFQTRTSSPDLEAEKHKVEQEKQKSEDLKDVIRSCKGVLNSLGHDLVIKLGASSDVGTAKFIATEMKRVVDGANCDVPA